MAHPSFEPVVRPRLSDELVTRIVHSVRDGRLTTGDRMPPILEMARRFRVAPATVREALVKLEMMSVVEVRHGAGVYVRGEHCAPS
jgi:GntR family transcriptional regulator, transcriptional repressor for pyruvate dehydrogenase complex